MLTAASIRQPHAIRQYIENGGTQDPVARFELARAARDEAIAIAKAPHLAQVSAPAEEVDQRPLTVVEVASTLACGFLAMAAMLAFGYATAPALARFIVAVREALA